MARLIVKSPYIKGGGAGGGPGGYLKYIGTREGVELLPSGYMEYMAERPRSHGLFGDEDAVDMSAAMKELNEYPGNIWTHIISLKREDAERLGYDHAAQWRNLIRAHRNDIASAMNIPPSDFRWYAAFHDEGGHPHIHMMAWSAKPGQAYLSRDGIRKIKSALTNDIFKQELLHTYEQKSSSREELVRRVREEMKALVQEMRTSLGSHPEVELLMMTLVTQLESVTGKKTYGYLPKTVKKTVDEVVNLMEQLPVINECYQTWWEFQCQIEDFYSEKERQRPPLSQQREFRSIKNAVIQEAENIRMGTVIFEDTDMDEPTEFSDLPYNCWESVLSPINNITLTNQRAKILYYKNDLDAAVSCFEKLPFPLSDASRILLSIIHLKRGSYEDGLVQVEYLRNLYPDSAKILAIQAHLLFGQAIETLNPHIQYGQALFVDSHYFLPNADQQAILAQVYQCLENLLRVTERGENPVLREWAYGMLVSVSMILPGKDARLWINHFQAQFPNSSLLVLAYLSCGLSVPGDLAEYCMNRLPDSGDNLQIKFRLLISQNRFEEADTLLREHSDEFVEMENASLADIRFSLLMQKQDWAMAADLATKEPDGTGKRRMQYLINAWSGQQPKKAAAKKLWTLRKKPRFQQIVQMHIGLPASGTNGQRLLKLQSYGTNWNRIWSFRC